jgi:hypothetical protein
MKCTNLLIILFLLIPFLSRGQTTAVDSIHKNYMNDDCEGKIFIRVETLPSLKKGTATLSDSITNYISSRDASFNNTAVTFMFIVGAKGGLFELGNMGKHIPNETILKNALLFYSDMWVPAIQNLHIVCAYVHCEMKFEGNKLSIKVF